jgi:hypothetical protein
MACLLLTILTSASIWLFTTVVSWPRIQFSPRPAPTPAEVERYAQYTQSILQRLAMFEAETGLAVVIFSVLFVYVVVLPNHPLERTRAKRPRRSV